MALVMSDRRRNLVAAAAMRADGLGMGWIHFRVNASQLQNAIRLRIDPEGKLNLASQAALVRMRELLAEVTPLKSNFAALAIENSTAVRQFLAMVVRLCFPARPASAPGPAVSAKEQAPADP